MTASRGGGGAGSTGKPGRPSKGKRMTASRGGGGASPGKRGRASKGKRGPGKRAGDPGRAESLRDLARKTGASATAARRWVRHPLWPFRRVPPWDVEKVLAWRRTILDPDNASSPGPRSPGVPVQDISLLPLPQRALTLWRIRRATTEQQRIDRESGRVHDAVECRERRLRQLHLLKSRLLSLPRTLAPGLLGKSSDEIEGLLRSALCEALNGLAAGIPPAPPAEKEGVHHGIETTAGAG